MSHFLVSNLLGDYLDELLSDADRKRVELHLADCEECSAELRSLRQTLSLLSEAFPEIVPDARFTATVMDAVDGQATPLRVLAGGRRWVGPVIGLAAAASLLILIWPQPKGLDLAADPGPVAAAPQASEPRNLAAGVVPAAATPSAPALALAKEGEENAGPRRVDGLTQGRPKAKPSAPTELTEEVEAKDSGDGLVDAPLPPPEAQLREPVQAPADPYYSEWERDAAGAASGFAPVVTGSRASDEDRGDTLAMDQDRGDTLAEASPQSSVSRAAEPVAKTVRARKSKVDSSPSPPPSAEWVYYTEAQAMGVKVRQACSTVGASCRFSDDEKLLLDAENSSLTVRVRLAANKVKDFARALGDTSRLSEKRAIQEDLAPTQRVLIVLRIEYRP